MEQPEQGRIIVCKECGRPMALINGKTLWHCAWCPRAIPFEEAPITSHSVVELGEMIAGADPQAAAFGNLLYAVINYRDKRIVPAKTDQSVIDAACDFVDAYRASLTVELPVSVDAVRKPMD